MKSHLADLVRLFILVNLLVLALFTIPVYKSDHDKAKTGERQLQANLVTVSEVTTATQHKPGF